MLLKFAIFFDLVDLPMTYVAAQVCMCKIINKLIGWMASMMLI